MLRQKLRQISPYPKREVKSAELKDDGAQKVIIASTKTISGSSPK